MNASKCRNKKRRLSENEMQYPIQLKENAMIWNWTKTLG